jgi:hypothetical protein
MPLSLSLTRCCGVAPASHQILKERAEAAIVFLYHRIQANKGGHMIINTHYPSDCNRRAPLEPS